MWYPIFKHMEKKKEANMEKKKEAKFENLPHILLFWLSKNFHP